MTQATVAPDRPYHPPYSSALTAQLTIIERMRRPDWQQYNVETLTNLGYPEAFGTLEQIITGATPIFWSFECKLPPFAEMPHAPPYPFDYPVLQGFLWFEQPVLSIYATDGEPGYVDIQGFAWCAYKPGGKFQYPVLLVPLTRVGPTGFVVIESRPDAPIPADAPGAPPTYKISHLFCHCMHFMNQRLLVDVQSHPANHAARKQARRLGIAPSDIRIVQYRKRVPAPADGSGDGEHRHYTIQFPVTGHWRMQPCGPGRQTVRRVWVREHLKGPRDAPVVRRTRLLTVVR